MLVCARACGRVSVHMPSHETHNRIRLLEKPERQRKKEEEKRREDTEKRGQREEREKEKAERLTETVWERERKQREEGGGEEREESNPCETKRFLAIEGANDSTAKRVLVVTFG